MTCLVNFSLERSRSQQNLYQKEPESEP